MKEKALKYHSCPTAGKVGVVSTKPCRTQEDLALAYTPGVASACLEIKENPAAVWDYTAKGNMVAVVSDGTAVLGLGNIGPEAGIPVMEGKAVLFKRFADIDSISTRDSDSNTSVDDLEKIERALFNAFGIS